MRRNKGAPGIDDMSVDALPEYLKHHWLDIRASIEAGRYRPQPVRRVEMPLLRLIRRFGGADLDANRPAGLHSNRVVVAA